MLNELDFVLFLGVDMTCLTWRLAELVFVRLKRV
jgi:hypothetical protein